MIPQGGGLRPPPWGILAFSRNREIRIASDGLGKGFFGFLLNISKRVVWSRDPLFFFTFLSLRLWAITNFVKKFETLAKSSTFLKQGFGCTAISPLLGIITGKVN